MHPLAIGARDLVVLAGLPGAGKSTLLAGLGGRSGAAVCDSDQVRRPLRSWLPGVPYRLYRPLVHLAHQLRVVVAVLGAPGPVLVHDPATRAATRWWLAALARLTRRPAVFVWLDVPADQALAGQAARGRRIRPASFARHVARATALRGTLLAGAVPPGWSRAVVLDRAGARASLLAEARRPISAR